MKVPNAPEPPWTPRKALLALLRPEITRMVLFIYLPLLIPVTVAAGLASRWVDGLLGWPPLPGWPLNVALFALLTAIGLLIVGWCYSYIVIEGRGGPAPLVAPPATELITSGPYGLVRHPSVWGKLCGVVGLGFLLRSPFFLLVLIPLALTGSLVEKRFFMERRELTYWGDLYQRYQDEVPFFLPRLSAVLRLVLR